MRPAALGIAYYAWVSRRVWLKAGLSIAAGLAVIGLGLLPVGEFFCAIALFNAYLFMFFTCVLFSVIVNESGNRIGFPRTLFRLPLRTATLVFWPWLFGVATLAGWWISASIPLNLIDSDGRPVLAPAFALAATIAWIQVAVWAPVRDLIVKLWCLPAAMTLPGALAWWLYFGVGLPYFAVVAVLVGCLALSFPAAVAAVAADRRGDVWLEGLVLAGRLQPKYREPGPDSQAFGSIVSAQRWYNRASPRGALVRVFGASAFAQLALLLAISRMDPQVFNPHLMVFGFAILPLLFVSPIALAVANARTRLGAGSTGLEETSTFVLLRPMSSGRLATSLLESALLGVLQSWLLCLGGALVAGICWSAMSPIPGQILQGVTAYLGRLPLWQAFGVVLLSCIAVVGLTWRLVTNRLIVRPAVGQRRLLYFTSVLSNLGQFAFLAISASLLLDPETRPITVSVLTWLGLPILGVKILVAATAFRVARRDGLLDRPAVREVIVLWAVVALPGVCLAVVVVPGLGLPVPAGFVILWTAILVPLARFALIPLGLEAARHR
jgi:hypothetical protein